MFRKIFFWSHLTAGVFVALFVAFMAVTGATLAFEPQIMRYFERRLLKNSETRVSSCMSPGELMFVVQQQTLRPIGTLQIFSDSSIPAQIQFGKEDVLFVNPCTGRVLSGAATKVRSFLVTVRNLHVSVSLEHERGGVLQELKNAANLGFCFLILSGLVLWMPRRWRKANIQAVTMFRARLRGRARDWNWHNVTGFWLALPLLVMTGTGAIMSYSWAETLLYRASGSSIPTRDGEHQVNDDRSENNLPEGMQPRTPHPEDAGRENASSREDLSAGLIKNQPEVRDQRDPETGADENTFDHHANETRPEDKRKFGNKRNHGERRGLARPLTASEFLSINPLIEIAKTKMPSWQNIRLRITGGSAGIVTFMFDDGDESQGKGQRSQLQLDRLSGEILQWTPPDQAAKGQRWRAYARFLHTGEALGFPGQVVAFTAALAALLLLCTGLALSIRRFFAWRARTARLRPVRVGYASEKMRDHNRSLGSLFFGRKNLQETTDTSNLGRSNR
jgi:uncharacterized iron-regulated membrane protein